MKVLHLIRRNTQLKSTFIFNQVSGSIKADSIVAYYETDSDEQNGGFTSLDRLSVPTYCIKGSSTLIGNILYRLVKKINHLTKTNLKKIISDENVNLIHLHYGSDAGLYLPTLYKLGVPTIVSFYGYDSFSFPKKYFGFGGWFLRNRVFKNATYVLAMTEEMKRDLIKAGCPPKKIIIHYHGVPDTLAGIERHYSDGLDCNLMMLSYLDPVKGHLFVLKSLDNLIRRGVKNFRLRIYGDGHYRKDIALKIDELNLGNYVSMEGSLKYQSAEYIKAFQEADIFLHPSVQTKDDKEGVPGAMVEAMFSGIPTIATFHGGIPYVLKDSSMGILVEEHNEVGLSEAIELLMTQRALRESMGKEARKFALKSLSIVKRQKALEDIYTRCLD